MMRAASSPMEPLNKNILLAGEMIADKWKIGEKIGEGTFSQIYSAYSIESRDKVAVKVEAPSSLKPVLEWESLILKSLQDCLYVCRYYYHGKHGDSTVLVMELLGDSMSMLRMSPDSIYGVPLAKSISVGLEMLDCIEAFHRHGYVHRDIKASNFALSALPDRHPLRQQRYYIIDFGLSRQHIGEDRQVLPARPVAEFRGTSMYASLSSHRRQELGPKDDLWSWFYLVMDFMRGELPWAGDAQLKNRQTVLSLKEYYTETNPSLLVEGLSGAMQLVEMMDYLQSLKYEDIPDYGKIRKQLQAVGDSSLDMDNSDSGNEELSADKKANQALAAVSSIDWSAVECERERALMWVSIADELKHSDEASDALLAIAKRYKMFFDCDGLVFDEQVRIQNAVYRIEKKLRARSRFLVPPPIQSFVKRRQSEQKLRSDALRKRRDKDFQVRQSLEIENEKRRVLAASIYPSNEAVHELVGREGASEEQNGDKCGPLQPHISESSMECSDIDDGGNRRNGHVAGTEATISASEPQLPYMVDDRPATVSGPMPLTQLSHAVPPASLGSRWDRNPNHGGAIPPPPPPSPWLLTSAQRSGLCNHRPPPPPLVLGQHTTTGGIPPPLVALPFNGVPVHHPPPPRSHSSITGHRYASAPDRHYGASVEAKNDNVHGHQWSLRDKSDYSLVQQRKPEAREDRGYGFQKLKEPLQDSALDRHYNVQRVIREDRGYSSNLQKSLLDSDRRYDTRTENKEDRGYTNYRQSPHKANTSAIDAYDDVSKGTTEGRVNKVQLPLKAQMSPKTSRDHYMSGGVRGYLHKKERIHNDKRSRSFSRSRSLRREEHRFRRRSYSRSSSRSRSKSYSVSPSRSASRSPSPYSRSYCRSGRVYTDRRRETKIAKSEREHSRRQRSRSCSSSRSFSSQSPSASPPAKRYRRRSSDLSPLRSLRRHSPYSTLRHPSHSKEYSTKGRKGYSKELVNDHSKEYAKDYSKEYGREYPKKYTDEHSKEYVTDYSKRYFSKRHPEEHVRDYRRHSRSRDAHYRRSFSQDRHRSHSREHGRDDESRDVVNHFKPASAFETKHRRSSRWQPRP